ncbi:ABC transporter permease [Pseudomaricurvus alkylphenolicus]|uniref:ABC transporter permease n=1 Tax=Pseudomaricurvus alkylphenolicus TaxID=1306991 RepID=UPI00141F80E3|nr:ABC transporter permease [Pseudomaricurvus alkylphenolicus]NIB41436.1 ABC transporter permease [Pseudomaricurvus alkylphenolicus]
MFIRLASKSLLNRKGSVLLTLMAMSVSIFVLLGVEHIRHQTKDSFNSTVSGVDLIVGARTGSLNLLLYSVFRIGSPTNNIGWETYQAVASNSKVAWSVPIALGDSHKGYRVMGTTSDYFKHFRYGQKRQLEFSAGQQFSGIFDVVLGSEVARKLGYTLGDPLVLAHGIAKTSFSLHDDMPFKVVGILETTGTPVDQTLHVSLQGIEAIHLNWQQGVKLPGRRVDREQLNPQALEPESITAFMLGLSSRMATFRVQRDINNYAREPLSAILPGVALSELWQMMGLLENTLRLIAGLILIAALLGLSAMMLASIREREHEIHLLRVIGAPPLYLFLLIELEAILIALTSIILGLSGLYICLLTAGDFLASSFGLHIGTNIFSGDNTVFLLLIIGATIIAAMIPSFSAYRNAKASL